MVTSVNRSGKPLRSLELDFESAESRGVLTLPGLADGASVDARMLLRGGEGGETSHAVLLDGKRLLPREGYIEKGNHLDEVIGRVRP